MRVHWTRALALLVLAVVAGGAGQCDSQERPRFFLGVEAIENGADGSVRLGCLEQLETTAGSQDRWWISFGHARPGADGAPQAVTARTYCGRGTYDAAVEGLGRMLGSPWVIVDLGASLSIESLDELRMDVSLETREISGFDAEGKPSYARRSDRRSALLSKETTDEMVIPLLIPAGEEAIILGVHELLLRLQVGQGRQGDPAAYGAVAVSADTPGAEILLDGGQVGRVLEGTTLVVSPVAVGERQIVVRDYSGREARKRVTVAEGKTVAADLRVMSGVSDSAVDTDLIALGANPQGGDEFWRSRDGALVVRVPEGEFLMGTSGDRAAKEEGPQHRVFVSAFLIDKVEVTWRQFRKFSRDTGSALPEEPLWGTPDDYPVSGVKWDQAHAYCEWVGGRLPTEAEWEKAARGTDGRTYLWGERWDPSYCNSWQGGPHRPLSAGSHPRCVSPFGVLDLGGSMWEWCSDWYGESYYAESPARDPQGPEIGNMRVVRGGAWLNQGNWLRPAYRHKMVPQSRYVSHGFRCVQGDAE